MPVIEQLISPARRDGRALYRRRFNCGFSCVNDAGFWLFVNLPARPKATAVAKRPDDDGDYPRHGRRDVVGYRFPIRKRAESLRSGGAVLTGPEMGTYRHRAWARRIATRWFLLSARAIAQRRLPAMFQHAHKSRQFLR